MKFEIFSINSHLDAKLSREVHSLSINWSVLSIIAELLALVENQSSRQVGSHLSSNLQISIPENLPSPLSEFLSCSQLPLFASFHLPLPFILNPVKLWEGSLAMYFVDLWQQRRHNQHIMIWKNDYWIQKRFQYRRSFRGNSVQTQLKL